MSNVRLKWKRGALKKLRHDPRIAQFLLKKADQIAADAGGKDIGYMVTNLVLEEPRTAVSVRPLDTLQTTTANTIHCYGRYRKLGGGDGRIYTLTRPSCSHSRVPGFFCTQNRWPVP